jgi:hypothetical protein
MILQPFQNALRLLQKVCIDSSLSIACLIGLTALAACSKIEPESADITARILSSRPDMVTGGDALIELSALSSALPSEGLSVLVNGQDVTNVFRASASGDSRLGRVDGLLAGDNRLEVRVGSTTRVELTLTNYPATGPVFSGPHQLPYICQTEVSGLGNPLNGDCSAQTRVQYFYRTTEPLPLPGGPAMPPPANIGPAPGFKRYEPSAARPEDMTQTTTRDGHVVDYIVRRETGTINRAIYDIAFLHVPGEPLPDPWTSAPGWNGRLVYAFGGGCAAGYRQGLGEQVINDAALSEGYAVATSSLNVFGNNCNDLISAETMMMVKEYFIEHFGVPVHTIGTGGSGGSMQQHLIAQNYPGLLDGIIPGVSFPDIFTMIGPVTDCSLLAAAFDADEEAWTDEQKTAVSGFSTWRTCEAWNRSFSPALIRPQSCNAILSTDSVYDSQTNAGGVRCDIFENTVNVLGRDPETGFARRTLDNVGVRYGLAAFNAGIISAEQFLQLNERIGGYDNDGSIVPDRTRADPVALRSVYETGRVNSGGGSVGSIPILDLRVYLDAIGDIHDSVRSFAMRARLIEANGNADNQVLLRLPIEIMEQGEGQAVVSDSFGLVDTWLDNIAHDTSPGSSADKVARNKPAELASDVCWTAEGERIVEPASYQGDGRCDGLMPAHADPRIAAGGPLTGDILKCQLKPIDPSDYSESFTAAQLQRLEAAFPDGVCDYARPGVGQVPTASTWRRF